MLNLYTDDPFTIVEKEKNLIWRDIFFELGRDFSRKLEHTIYYEGHSTTL
jgi:hypothetical protein